MSPQDKSATTADLDFVLTRVFDAPRELVFRVWTEPRHLARWWGPHTFTNPVCTVDLRPGGAYRIVMQAPNGDAYPLKGVYQEIVPPERLVMTVDCSEHPAAWHDMILPNRAPEDTNPVGVLVQTVTFEDLDGKTRLTLRMRFPSAVIRAAMLKMGMTEGWSQSLDRLASELTILA